MAFKPRPAIRVTTGRSPVRSVAACFRGATSRSNIRPSHCLKSCCPTSCPAATISMSTCGACSPRTDPARRDRLGVVWLARQGWSIESWRRSGLVYVLLALALAPTVMWRFDALPTALTVAAMVTVAHRRAAAAGVALGAAMLAKLYPVAMLPALLVGRIRDGRLTTGVDSCAGRRRGYGVDRAAVRADRRRLGVFLPRVRHRPGDAGREPAGRAGPAGQGRRRTERAHLSRLRHVPGRLAAIGDPRSAVDAADAGPRWRIGAGAVVALPRGSGERRPATQIRRSSASSPR